LWGFLDVQEGEAGGGDAPRSAPLVLVVPDGQETEAGSNGDLVRMSAGEVGTG
jgi:hypothetical protein